MKLKLIALTGLVSLTTILPCFAIPNGIPQHTALKRAAEPLNSIVAVVNDSIITNAELEKRTAAAVMSLKQNNIAIPPSDVLRKQVLDQLINHELQLQQAKQMGVIITPEQVDQAISKIAAENHITTAQLYQTVKNSGSNVNDFRSDIQDQLTIQTAQQQAVANHISISQDEIEDDIEQLHHQRSTISAYHLQDILIALPDSPTPAQIASTRAKAMKIYQQLKHGANFNQIAVSDSSGDQALKAGDLGWRPVDELPTPFVTPVKGMQVGDISQPIQAPNGFHILKLLEVKSSGITGTPEQQRTQVANMIFQREMGQAIENWIAQLRAQAYIKIY